MIGTCPVADLKTDLAEPRPDPLVDVTFSVPWDGKDGSGNGMTGEATVSYSFQLFHVAGGQVIDPKIDSAVQVGKPVLGSIRVSLGSGAQLP